MIGGSPTGGGTGSGENRVDGGVGPVKTADAAADAPIDLSLLSGDLTIREV